MATQSARGEVALSIHCALTLEVSFSGGGRTTRRFAIPAVPLPLESPAPIDPGRGRRASLASAAVHWTRSQGQLRLDIFDISGRKVWGQALSRDATVTEWNARDANGVTLAPGVYLARLTAGEWRSTNKVTVAP